MHHARAFYAIFCKNGRRPYYHTITHCLLSLINEFVFVDELLELGHQPFSHWIPPLYEKYLLRVLIAKIVPIIAVLKFCTKIFCIISLQSSYFSISLIHNLQSKKMTNFL